MTRIELTSSDFSETTLKSEEVSIVDFYAEWCSPCKMLHDTLLRLEHDVPMVKICKLNIDTNFDVAQNFKISNIPTLIFFKNGKEEKRIVGVRKIQELQDLLSELVDQQN